ncbi:MAG: hypothetical protein FJX90_04040 [Bacteroidetes bacterium]|nr:hypothetical protein [Bacteroidota bacterium]
MKNFYLFLFLISTLVIQKNQAQTSALSNGIYHYSKVEETMKFIIANKVVMQLENNQVRGFYGWAAQGESSFYFEGNLNENEIKGSKYDLYTKQSSPFNCKIKGNSLSLESPSGPVIISKSSDDLIENFGSYNIFSKPDIASPIIQSNVSLKENHFQIIAISKFGSTGDQYQPYNVWYKVKSDNLEGWVVGVISTF